MRDTPKWPGKLEHGKRPKGTPQHAWKEGIQKILKERGIEWNGVRAVA